MAADSQITSLLQQLQVKNEKSTTEHTQSQENLLNHILLPRFISAAASIEAFGQEITLLSRLCETVRSSSQWMPASTVRLLASFERIHQSNESEATIHDELNKLGPGETFAMFVRRRNTVFMCHMPALPAKRHGVDESTPLIVATFDGQVEAKEIYASPMDLMVGSEGILPCFNHFLYFFLDFLRLFEGF